MRRRSRLVGLLWRWHRRLGLLIALFVLVVAVTGIALNHTTGLGLDRRFVNWAWLTASYGDHSAALPAFQLGQQWLTRSANGLVFLDTVEVAPCRGELVGALRQAGLLVAGCARELLLITPRGELVESVSAGTGLPVPVQSIGLLDGELALQVEGDWWLADLDRLVFNRRAPGGSAEIRQLFPDRLPGDIRRNLPVADEWLTWERVLLDLHSGRLFGRPGVLWVDLVGVFLCGLAISGSAMWWLHRRKRARAGGK
jgi:hypothetical protein